MCHARSDFLHFGGGSEQRWILVSLVFGASKPGTELASGFNRPEAPPHFQELMSVLRPQMFRSTGRGGGGWVQQL